jgi:hypothetical protein
MMGVGVARSLDFLELLKMLEEGIFGEKHIVGIQGDARVFHVGGKGGEREIGVLLTSFLGAGVPACVDQFKLVGLGLGGEGVNILAMAVIGVICVIGWSLI